MNFYIKEWPDNTATLMTEGGHVVWIFPTVEEAEEAAENDFETVRYPNTRIERKVPRLKAVA